MCDLRFSPEGQSSVTQNVLRCASLATVSLVQIIAALERGYEGYAIPVRFTPEALLKRIRSEHIDLTQSALLLDDADAVCGCMLIARRGRRSRIAAIGISPEKRGSGIGRQAVDLALAQARERGDTRVILEVLTSNVGAKRLYERCGFVARRSLVGYERPAASASGEADIAIACDSEQVLADLLRFYPDDVSWQIDPQGFAGSVPPLQAFRSAEGAVALVEPAGANMHVLAIAVPPEQRRRAHGKSFLTSIFNRFPGANWIIPARVPEGLATPFLLASGFRQTPLTQVEMEAVLAS
jgi:ribosomal protein S18 acetylase RimI-like enzyme